MKELLALRGELTITVTGPDGQIKDHREFNNLIVQVGKNFVANALIGASASPFTHMAIGTGTTPAALGDTGLQTETVRQAFNSGSATANVVSLSTTYVAGVGTGALTEAGIFNAASLGVMLSRVVFSVINKGAADSLTINWTVTAG